MPGWLVLAALAYVSAFARALLDTRFVYAEFYSDDPASFSIWTTAYTAIFGIWLWSLLAAARGSRRALLVALGGTLLIVALGIATTVALCPTPCQTAWPLGELLNWTNTLIGAAASVSLFRAWRTGPG